MSSFCVYLPLEGYLSDWFVHSHGGSRPVSLMRGSVESKILEVYLARRPDGEAPAVASSGLTAVCIPTFRHKPAEVYNHLPRRAMSALLTAIRNRFDVELWNELHCFGQIGRRQDELIYAWMEKHGIEPSETNWNAIAKRYQRQRDVYLNRRRAREAYSAKKLKKSS